MTGDVAGGEVGRKKVMRLEEAAIKQGMPTASRYRNGFYPTVYRRSQLH